MARKTAAQAVEEQIKDQAFSELTALIEESDKLLKSSAIAWGKPTPCWVTIWCWERACAIAATIRFARRNAAGRQW